MSYPTYNQVKRLAQGFAEGKNIRDRRRDGNDLVGLLNNSDVRQRLGAEANWRPQGLREMWRLLVGHVLAGLQDMHSSGKKSKLLPEDVRTLNKILEACVRAQEGFENELSSSKLTKKEVRSAVQFSLELLDEVDDGKLGIDFEAALLETLNQLCSCKEFVVHCRPENDTRAILEVAERRIEQDKPKTIIQAAQIFYRLLTASASMQISLDSLLPGCVKMVAVWCRSKHDMSEQAIGELEYMIEGVVVLLNSNPEQAIGPLTRHGAVILKFCKRRYGKHAIRQNHKERDALNHYFVAHIHVNQVAGRLEGLHAGDLGCLGPATMTEHHINAILGSAVELCTFDEFKKSIKADKYNKSNFPLHKAVHKRQLQVTARLLALAQRLFVAGMEWHANDENGEPDEQMPVETLLTRIQARKNRTDCEYLALDSVDEEDKGLGDDMYLKSPFCQHILRYLYAATADVSRVALDVQQPQSVASGLAMPLLHIMSEHTTSFQESIIIPLLQILCAAVEVFPAGDCWASSCDHRNWHQLPAPAHCTASFNVVASSPDDLAAVVYIVGSILESHGGATGERGVQLWVLVTLLRLTKATSVQLRLGQRKPESFNRLQATWQRIWSILFCPDFRYCAFTKFQATAEDNEGGPSVGCLVVALLECMVRGYCTDPAVHVSHSVEVVQSSFVFRQQESIWNLPVFANPRAEVSSACFELLYAVVFAFGLVEGFNDVICQDELDTSRYANARIQAECRRRCQLLDFCMIAFDSSRNETLAPSIAACVALLSHGNVQTHSSGYMWPSSLMISSAVDFRTVSALSVTDFSDSISRSRDEPLNTFHSMWETTAVETFCQSDKAPLLFLDEITSDFALTKTLALNQRIDASLITAKSVDCVSSHNVGELMALTTVRLCDMLSKDSCDEQVADGGELPKNTVQRYGDDLLVAKVLLSVVLSLPGSDSVTHLRAVEGILHGRLSLVEPCLKSLCQSDTSFMSVFLRLWQVISGLIGFVSISRADLPIKLAEFTSLLYTVVHGLVCDRLDPFSLPVSLDKVNYGSKLMVSESVDFLDDEGGDGVDDSHRKRFSRRDSPAPNPKRQRRAAARTEERHAAPGFVVPSLDALYLSSLLLLRLNPSLRSCERICAALLRISNVANADAIESDMPTKVCVVVCNMLCTEPVFLHQKASRRIYGADGEQTPAISVATLLYKVVEGTRRVVPPDSTFFPFGYDLCAMIARFSDSPLRGEAMTVDEASYACRLLKGLESADERRHFGLRPTMRALRLRATTDTFLVAGENLHDVLDVAYPVSFVLPSLSDASGVVRRQASTAVAAAITRMGDEERVIDSVRKFILPLSLDPNKVDEDYESWYHMRDSAVDSDCNRKQFWADAKIAIEWSTLGCWSAIAREVSSDVEVGRVIFDLVELSSQRKQMQSKCFSWLETVALSLGYKGVEELVESFTESLVNEWVGTHGYKLMDIPVLWSAPSLIRRCLDAGRRCNFDHQATSADHDTRLVALGDVQSQSVHYFMGRWRKAIIPRIIAKSVTSVETENATRDKRRRFLEGSYTREFCSLYDCGFSDDLVITTLRKTLPDIIAFHMILTCGNDFDKRTAVEFESLVEGLISKQSFLAEGKRRASTTLRRFLDKFNAQAFQLVEQDAFVGIYGAIERFVQTFGIGGDGRLFARVGSSATELLLFSLYRLSLSRSVSFLRKGYGAVHLVSESIVRQLNDPGGESNADFVFCIQSLSRLLLDPAFQCIQPSLVNTIELAIKEALRESKTAHVASKLQRVSKELISACMHVHEFCQLTIIQRSEEACRREMLARRRSLGLCTGTTCTVRGDSWGWSETSSTVSLRNVQQATSALTDHFKETDPSFLATLRGTYDVVFMLLSTQEDGSTGFTLSVNDFLGAAPPYKVSSVHFEALCAIEPCFSVQALMLPFFERNRVTGQQPDVPRLTEEISVTRRQRTRLNPITMGILKAQLVELSQILRQQEATGPASLSSSHQVDERLVRTLGAYCGCRFPEEIRVAAGRCLGQIQLSEDISVRASTETHECSFNLAAPGRGDDLNFSLRSRTIDVLVQSLIDPDKKVAMIALETLKLLLAADCLDTYQKHIYSVDSLSMVHSLTANDERESRKAFAVDTFEQDRLYDAACRISRTRLPRDGEWCWEKSLWQCSASVKYEDWMCCVFPAIIWCCYTRQSGQKASSSFFPLLLRMSAFDSDVSETAFMALVLDLLQNDRPDTDSQHVHGRDVELDTWLGHPSGHFNSALTASFVSLFEGFCGCSLSSNESQDTRALELALDTLDSLRQLTVRRFVESKSHCRNNSKNGRDDKESSQHREWNGVPFGTVLRLDGLLVARACLRAHRYMSALFYADMYADSRLGGPSRALSSLNPERAELPFSTVSTSDISGFGLAAAGRSDLHPPSNVPTVETLSFLKSLKDGLAGLLEIDSAMAIERLKTDFLLRQGHTSSLVGVDNGAQEDALAQLQCIDVQNYQRGRRGSSAIQTVHCLEKLGLASTVQSYVEGILLGGGCELTSSETARLRESWFENSLYRMSWDNLTLDLDNEASLRPPEQRRRSTELSGGQANVMGFHETLAETISSIIMGDTGHSQAQVLKARQLLLNSLPSTSNREVQLDHLRWSMDRLGALNLVEGVLNDAGRFDKSLLLRGQTLASPSERATPSEQSFASSGKFTGFTRELLLQSLYERELRDGNESAALTVKRRLSQQLWDSCILDCRDGRHEAALRALHRLFAVAKRSPSNDFEITELRLQEARILELSGDFAGAIRHVTQVIRLLRDKLSDDHSLLGEALVTCGQWMARYKVQPGNSILESYLEPGRQAAQLMYAREENKLSTERMTSSLLALAQLASDLFEAVCARMSSSEWRDQEQTLSYQENELEECEVLLREMEEKIKRKASKKDKAQLEVEIHNNKKYKTTLRKEVEKLKSERQSIMASRQHYRVVALRSVAAALQVARAADRRESTKYVYMLFSLWFSPSADQTAQGFDDAIQEIERIQSFRFVALANQFISQAGCDFGMASKRLYEEPLRKLILKMICDHPYHCLQHMIYLSHANEEEGSPKTAAARFMKEALRRNISVSRLLGNYELVVHAYMHLASFSVDKTKNSRGASISFSKIGKPADRLDTCLEGVPMEGRPCILTKPPQLRPLADYENLRNDPSTDLILGFEREFTIADGGINMPKVVRCVGTRQGRFKQLVKDKDEIRQDAVMQQIFGYVNDLMKRGSVSYESSRTERTSLATQLRLVTYTIVPLSPLCGVLEWVEDTVAFSDFIVDSGKGKPVGAHSRYYPGEWPNRFCKEHLEKATESKRQAFDQICRHYSPCFRFFFVEKFGHRMDEWYAAKLKYARSVAVSSIVGHVLGIGDRHGSNILVHQKTAEVVHIDFGIVFEQGRLLRTPEKVPFRLTQNMIDGLGPTGVEGAFTKASELTMRVLKNNTSALLTILTSIAADPLYMWAMSPVKARARQLAREKDDEDEEDDEDVKEDDDTEALVDVLKGKHDKEKSAAKDSASRNDQATHIIAKIQQKLQGYEEATSGEQQGIGGQIQLLINQARDPENLAVMFPGWAPWV